MKRDVTCSCGLSRGQKRRYDSSPSKGFVQVGDVTDIDCPDRTCNGKLINRQSSNGARFVTCTRGSKVDEKCNFSGNILFKDTRKISSTQDEAERLQRLCVSCLGEVHGASCNSVNTQLNLDPVPNSVANQARRIRSISRYLHGSPDHPHTLRNMLVQFVSANLDTVFPNTIMTFRHDIQNGIANNEEIVIQGQLIPCSIQFS